MAYIPAPTHHEESEGSGQGARGDLWRHLLVLAVMASVAVFLLAPWSFEQKAHAILHGICGQTESHTLVFGERLLPLDTRCVGIFGGLFCTMILLTALGRHKAAGLPSVGAGVLLLAFLCAMALDGVNSLITDLGNRHPYSPSNDLRLLTGWLAGVGLGSILIMVTGMTIWRAPRMRVRILPSWKWPILLALPCVPVWLLLRTGSAVIYYPVSMALIASAIVAFGALAVCAIVMLRNQDNSYDRFDQLAPFVMVGFLIALAILLFLGGGRFWIESALGLPSPA